MQVSYIMFFIYFRCKYNTKKTNKQKICKYLLLFLMFFITILACKFLLFCIFAAKESCLTATVRRLQKLGMLLNHYLH